MHLIVTPEYIRNVLAAHPDTTHLRAPARPRPDRRPTSSRPCPGTHWDEERGLDEHQYIVPGAGGVGEILNNAWV